MCLKNMSNFLTVDKSFTLRGNLSQTQKFTFIWTYDALVYKSTGASPDRFAEVINCNQWTLMRFPADVYSMQLKSMAKSE